MSLDAALIAARFVHLLSLLLVAGALAFPRYALPAGARATWWAASPGLRRSLAAGAGLALVSALLWFAAALGGMAGDPAAVMQPPMLRDAFTGTAFAPIWAGRVVLLGALMLAVARRPSDLTALALAGLALASVALTGHAQAETGAANLVHTVGDAAHLLAAALWLGALPCLALLLRRDPEAAAPAVRRFSAWAAPAVAILVATGAVQIWLLAGSPLGLAGTAWGRWMLVKLTLIAAMLGLAAWNRQRATPRLPASARELRRSALAELVLGAGVIAAVACLGTLPPTGG